MKIFEIKVYPFTEEEFCRKKSLFIDNFYEKNKNYDLVRNQNIYRCFYADKLTFSNYNIGYVDLCLVDDKIQFNVSIMLSQKCASPNVLKGIIDNLDSNVYPSYDMKLNEAKRIAGYKTVPYIPKLLTEKKHYMVNDTIGDNSIDIQCLTNPQIVKAIKEKINEISGNARYKKLYFDMTLFNATADYIDFKGMSLFERNEQLNALFGE